MYEPVDYFDEMNILQSDKERRVLKAGHFFDAMVNFFKAQFLNLLAGIFLYEITSEDYMDMLQDLYLTMAVDSTDRQTILKAERFGRYIQEATERAVKSAQGNESYSNAVMYGLKMKVADVPQSVRRMFSEERAMDIALNETNWIYNYDNHLKIAQDQNTHTWLSKRDERVRLHHIEADGQTVPIDEPFIIGGYPMMFPLDDSLGAPVDEIAGCRCVEI